MAILWFLSWNVGCVYIDLIGFLEITCSHCHQRNKNSQSSKLGYSYFFPLDLLFMGEKTLKCHHGDGPKRCLIFNARLPELYPSRHQGFFLCWYNSQCWIVVYSFTVSSDISVVVASLICIWWKTSISNIHYFFIPHQIKCKSLFYFLFWA